MRNLYLRWYVMALPIWSSVNFHKHLTKLRLRSRVDFMLQLFFVVPIFQETMGASLIAVPIKEAVPTASPSPTKRRTWTIFRGNLPCQTRSFFAKAHHAPTAILHRASSVPPATSTFPHAIRRPLIQNSTRLGIRGSFFCGQECFKAGCAS